MWGNEHWVWGEGEKWQRGRRKGPPSEQSPGATETRDAHVHKIPSVPAPSASSLAPTPPPKTPREVWGGTQLQNRSLWPHAPCPTPPLLPS